MNFQFRSKPEQLSGDKLLATNEYGDIIIFKGTPNTIVLTDEQYGQLGETLKFENGQLVEMVEEEQEQVN